MIELAKLIVETVKEIVLLIRFWDKKEKPKSGNLGTGYKKRNPKPARKIAGGK